MTTYEIKHGNALDVLRSMESESVQVSLCSPPYFGLRSYKTEPQIWDGDEFCDHEFISAPVKLLTENRNGKGSATLEGGSSEYRQALHGSDAGEAGFCRCGAWRGELGLEPTFQLYLSHLLQIFTEVKRVVKADGTIFINLGDSYAGSGKGIGDKNGHGKSVFTDEHIQKTDWSQMDVPAKSLMNIPHRFFIMLTDELGLIQRNNINWWKRACMPSSAKDRFTVDFESIGFFTRSARYKFNQILEAYEKPLDRWGGQNLVATQSEGWHTGTGQAIYRDRDMRPNPDGRNCRTTWDFPFEPQSSEHYAAYPSKMCDRMILAGSDAGDTVLDIFSGTASTGLSALRLNRNFVGIELNPDYIKIAEKRLAEVQVKLF